jgi:hypothetical protein
MTASRFILELEEGLLVAPKAARKSEARRIGIAGMSLRCFVGRKSALSWSKSIFRVSQQDFVVRYCALSFAFL